MKRTSFKRKKPWTKKPTKPLRKTPLRVKGKSTTSQLKREIQSLLREIVIKRDKNCILRKHRRCNDPVKQADHLIPRNNNATYADHRLVVLLCRSCHMWKKYHKEQYDKLVMDILPFERLNLWFRCLNESWIPKKKDAYDWQMEVVVLKNYLNNL